MVEIDEICEECVLEGERERGGGEVEKDNGEETDRQNLPGFIQFQSKITQIVFVTIVFCVLLFWTKDDVVI